MTHKILKDSIDKILKSVYQKKGDIFTEIAINWSKIAGNEFAYQAIPISINYYKTKETKKTCLVLQYEKGANKLELKFSEAIIIERINHYFGFEAVMMLKFK